MLYYRLRDSVRGWVTGAASFEELLCDLTRGSVTLGELALFEERLQDAK